MAVSMVVNRMVIRALLMAMCLVVQLFVLGGLHEAFAAGVGRIVYASGQVWVQRGSVSTAVRAGRHLLRNDIVITGPRGRAKLSMADGSRVYVGARSRIEVADYVTRGNNLFSGAFNMFWGKARFFVNKLVASKASFKVRTTTAVLGVRGTSFLMIQPMPKGIVGANNFDMDFHSFVRRYRAPTRVLLETGRVVFELPGGKLMEMRPGQTANIDRGGHINMHETRHGDANSMPSTEGGEPSHSDLDGSSKVEKTESDQVDVLPPAPLPLSANQSSAPGAGAALGASTGSGAAVEGAVNNAIQNLGTTTDISIQPRFVLP